MSHNQVQQNLNEKLKAQSFKMTAPDLEIAWHVFKEFAQEPLEVWKTSQVSVEFLHWADRDDELWLEFARRLEDDSGSAHVGCVFTHQVPPTLYAVDDGFYWQFSNDNRTLIEFFADVESSSEFKLCLSLNNWKWE